MRAARTQTQPRSPRPFPFCIGPLARAALCLQIALCSGLIVRATPYVPASDNEVLETLPSTPLADRNEITSLRRRLSRSPDDVDLAAEAAALYVRMGKAEGDPRYFGYARAAIGRWWDESDPPPGILKIRAKLKETDHRYDDAAADLRRLLQKEPRDVQAWIELSNIHRVKGRYDDARLARDSLKAFASPRETIFCDVPLQAATGEAVEAYASLAELLPVARKQWPGTVQWVLTMQAEIARALGRDAEAEDHYQEALANDPKDFYLLRAYADYLLDQGRGGEVLALLRDHVADTGVLLRAAIAARRAGDEALAANWTKQLENRFEEMRLRGGEPHGRFEARCALELQDDPKKALGLALANWARQKEIRDSRNVLEAAIAAEDRAAARPVLEFLSKNKTQDVALARLVERLERLK